ncbi:hypothetical protein NEIELOOT_02547 [Neisseria elongata subsp. glycolytica ATCC 29315]|uniref:Uncharacterized protein n=1 Tax=Neisseria elongata subsp. glycolytica ATCC 29315 TaxID=546263 RepID=D4DTZ1_NEIEG|nr:hypothetical protein NEIELOOT_02547 [Neisseria elongata subsp. glycolytica ATCC 29315]
MVCVILVSHHISKGCYYIAFYCLYDKIFEKKRPRPLQNSFFPDSRNLIKDFRLFLFQISTDSTQIPP